MGRVRGNGGFLRATKLSTPLLHPGSAFNRSFLLAELRMYLHLHIYGVSLYIQLEGSRFVLLSSPWRFVNLLRPSFLPLFFIHYLLLRDWRRLPGTISGLLVISILPRNEFRRN